MTKVRSETARYASALTPWLRRQRWFAGKSGIARLRILADVELGRRDDARILILLIADEGESPAVYQVPILEWEADTPVGIDPAAAVEDDGGRIVLSDGSADPMFVAAILDLVRDAGAVHGGGAVLRGAPIAAFGSDRIRAVTALSGEQSNTSVVISFEDRPAMIMKIFRMIHDGRNPDVELQSGLSRAGSGRVPASVGSIWGEWQDPRVDGIAAGELVFIQEFLPEARDAWRVALTTAERGEDLSAMARSIGEAVAEVHRDLAAGFETADATAAEVDQTRADWQARFEAAVRLVPQLADERAGVEAVYDRAAVDDWPRLQRIHGDLHLGQLLVRADGRIAIVDFEGEPLRPLSQRRIPDLAERDVAGMLRSFDYAAGSVSAPPAGWSEAAREAFLDGYGRRDSHRPLLHALELDKAVYEVLYEAQNRPSWLPIPLAAVRRLAA